MSAIAASSTQTVELETLHAPSKAVAPAEPTPALLTSGRRLGSVSGHDDHSHDGASSGPEDGDVLPPPSTATRALEKWNSPRSNAWRIAASFWSFFVCGANDAAYGALIPYLEKYYNLSYIVVSLVFLSPFIGYVAAALMNNWLHIKIGPRWIGLMCGACHMVGFLVLSQHPPYPVLVFSFAIVGLGIGIGDAAWNAWIGNLARSNELLGFLHGCYGVGGTISPLIATTMINKGGLEWYHYYYVLVSYTLRSIGFMEEK